MCLGQTALGTDSLGGRQPWGQTALGTDSPGDRQPCGQTALGGRQPWGQTALGRQTALGSDSPGDRQHSAGRSLPAWLPRSREQGDVQSPGGRGWPWEARGAGCPTAEGREGWWAGGLEQRLASVPNAELYLGDRVLGQAEENSFAGCPGKGAQWGHVLTDASPACTGQ